MRLRFFALSLLLVSFPFASRAESSPPPPPTCNVRAWPSDGATIPANAPVPFSLVSSGIQPRALTLTKVTPETTFTAKPNGDLATTMYVPNSPLTENTTYRVAWEVDCPVAPAVGEPKQPSESSFRTSGNVDLPTTVGTASVVEALADVRVDVTPSKELAAYLPLATFEVAVGERQLEGIGRAGYWSNARPSFTIIALEACGQQRAVDLDLPITIGATILGASKNPTPLTVMGHFACSQLPTYPSTSSSSSGAPSDAGPDDPGATNGDNVAANSCACQTPARTGASFGPFLLAATGVALVRRRSRSRSRA